jgi:hypothetical protein
MVLEYTWACCWLGPPFWNSVAAQALAPTAETGH